MKPTSYGVCCYKITDTTEILLMRAKGHKNWGFIKGKIDKGETPKECAVRECLEETGIVIDQSLLEDMYYQTGDKKNVGIFMVDSVNVDFSTISLCPREVEELKWFKITDYIDIQMNQRKILKKIINFYIKRVYYFNKGNNE